MLITDGVYSFSVFTYNCGLIEWDNGGSSTIGFNAAGQVYYNKNPTGIDLACINGNASVWSNVIYTLSMIPNIPVEPGIYNIYILLVLKNNALYHCLNDYSVQERTLDFIEITSPDGMLDSDFCIDPDCSKKIIFPADFPFGGYNHSKAFVRTI